MWLILELFNECTYFVSDFIPITFAIAIIIFSKLFFHVELDHKVTSHRIVVGQKDNAMLSPFMPILFMIVVILNPKSNSTLSCVNANLPQSYSDPFKASVVGKPKFCI
jgi:hypothetical protein